VVTDPRELAQNAREENVHLIADALLDALEKNKRLEDDWSGVSALLESRVQELGGFKEENKQLTFELACASCRIEELEGALRHEWELNHEWRCSIFWPHTDPDVCCYPLNPALDSIGSPNTNTEER
jgi:hypothetical protein